MKRLWIDDFRSPPEDENWIVARTYDDARAALLGEEWDEVALDNDLGDPDIDHQGIFLLSELADREMLGGPRVPKITILTSSGAARQYMETTLRRIEEWRNS